MKNLILGSLLSLTAISVNAAPFVIGSDIYNGSDTSNNTSYSGAYTSSQGVVSDGGLDAFDGFGYLQNYSGLAVQRQADVLQDLDTYRWVDTLTNNSNSDFSGSIRFFGNLGSDSGTVVDATGAFSTVSHESHSGRTFDPVFGFVWGNNSWAANNVSLSRNYDSVYSDITLNLGIGESISIVHFAGLFAPDADDYYTDSYGRMWRNSSTPYNPTDYINAAQSWASGMIANPYFSGLSANTIASIANFDDGGQIPVPAPLTLMGLGLAAIGFARKRKA